MNIVSSGYFNIVIYKSIGFLIKRYGGKYEILFFLLQVKKGGVRGMEVYVVIVIFIVERCLKVVREDILGKIGDIIQCKWIVFDLVIKKFFVMIYVWFIGFYCNGYDQMWWVNFIYFFLDEQGVVGNFFKNSVRNEIFEVFI